MYWDNKADILRTPVPFASGVVGHTEKSEIAFNYRTDNYEELVQNMLKSFRSQPLGQISRQSGWFQWGKRREPPLNITVME